MKRRKKNLTLTLSQDTSTCTLSHSSWSIYVEFGTFWGRRIWSISRFSFPSGSLFRDCSLSRLFWGFPSNPVDSEYSTPHSPSHQIPPLPSSLLAPCHLIWGNQPRRREPRSVVWPLCSKFNAKIPASSVLQLIIILWKMRRGKTAPILSNNSKNLIFQSFGLRKQRVRPTQVIPHNINKYRKRLKIWLSLQQLRSGG